MHFLTAEDLNLLISGCILNKREYQQKMYNSFFTFGMSICDRYTKRKEDSIKILNKGFLKIFKGLNQYVPYYEDEVASFKCWITNILVFTAIDHNRRYDKYDFANELDTTNIHTTEEDILTKQSIT